MHGSRTLGSLTTGPEHPGICPSLLLLQTEDSWMIIKFGHNRGVHVIYASQSPQSPKGLLLNQGISKPDPDPVFYREVDLSDLPSEHTETLKLRQYFLISLCPGTVCLGPLPQSEL